MGGSEKIKFKQLSEECVASRRSIFRAAFFISCAKHYILSGDGGNSRSFLFNYKYPLCQAYTNLISPASKKLLSFFSFALFELPRFGIEGEYIP